MLSIHTVDNFFFVNWSFIEQEHNLHQEFKERVKHKHKEKGGSASRTATRTPETTQIVAPNIKSPKVSAD